MTKIEENDYKLRTTAAEAVAKIIVPTVAAFFAGPAILIESTRLATDFVAKFPTGDVPLTRKPTKS